MTEIKDLNTRVSFYEFRANAGPEPGETEAFTLYECWASVENIWMRDVERAKETGTLEDLTITIRDPRGYFLPQRKHYVGLNEGSYYGNRYNIKSVRPDLKNKEFITVIAGLVT